MEKFFPPALALRITAWERETGLSLERGLRREEYLSLYAALGIRRLGQFTEIKTALTAHLHHLVETKGIPSRRERELAGIFFRDLPLSQETSPYFRDISQLERELEERLRQLAPYDPARYDPARAALLLSWFGFSLQELCNIKKVDILPKGIRRGEQVLPLPSDVLVLLWRFREAEGYYQKAKGEIFRRYLPSPYLFRSERNAQLTRQQLSALLSRLTGEKGQRPLTVKAVYWSGLFHRLYVAECIDCTLTLSQQRVEELSALFGEDLSSPQRRMTRLAEYRRYKLLFAPPPPERPRRLRAQTFGNFELFCQDQPVHFRRRRTKELLAYLVDRRGAGCTMGELCSTLWEGRPDTPSLRSQLRSLIADLRATLEELGEGGIIRKERNLIALDPGRLDCDYYRFLAGDPAAIQSFQGEYMANYSWGEVTVGALQTLENGRRI